MYILIKEDDPSDEGDENIPRDQTGPRQPQALKHLKVLSDNRILEAKADVNRRNYKLRPEPFQALDSWAKSFRRDMDDRFDNLEDYLQEL